MVCFCCSLIRNGYAIVCGIKMLFATDELGKFFTIEDNKAIFFLGKKTVTIERHQCRHKR